MQKKIILIVTVLLFSLVALNAQEKTENYDPWPVPGNIESGMLKVSDIHTLHYMTGGNPDGIPVFILHGGPGAETNKFYFSYVDPERFFIVTFDQRGCGKSKPFAEIRENTTQDLVDDINKLKTHLEIEEPAVIWGISWGTTLALAYAETYPEQTAGLILVNTFTGLKWEIDHMYHGGAGVNWPENYAWFAELLENKESDAPGQYYAMVTGEDENLAAEAAKRIIAYELTMVMSQMTTEQAIEIAGSPFGKGFATILTYYMMNQCFLEEGQLLKNAVRIKDIPTFMVSGRADSITPPKASYDLSQLLDNVVYEVAAGSLHGDPKVLSLARKGAIWIADMLQAK